MPPPAAPAAVPAQGTGTGSCNDYIPRDLAIDVPSAAPGQTVTITGFAYPGDTVTIRIATLGGPPIILGTAVAGVSGLFTAQVTIPADFVEGTYNITVSSPNCEGVGTITIVVSFPQGRCTARKTITAARGDTVTWDLLGVLDQSKPVTVLLIPVGGGPSVVMYTGPYPASGSVTFVVPNNLGNGRYRIVESGTGPNGKPRSTRCGRLRVRGGGGSGTTTTTVPGSTTTTVPGSTTTVPGGSTTTTPGGECDVVEFDGTKLIDFDGYNPKVEYTGVFPLTLAAGGWVITSATSRDGYPNRVNVLQTSEVWEIQFLDGSGNVLATSAPTPDLQDYVALAEWIGALGDVQLPAGVVGVRAHHLPDLYPDAPDGVANSVFPIGFTICPGGTGNGTTTTAPTATTTTTAPATTTTTVPVTTTTVPNGKVTICHRTASQSNPYTKLEVAQAAVDGDGGNDKGQGDHYLEHLGPVGPVAQGEWGDIIPPIPGVHDGRNDRRRPSDLPARTIPTTSTNTTHPRRRPRTTTTTSTVPVTTTTITGGGGGSTTTLPVTTTTANVVVPTSVLGAVANNSVNRIGSSTEVAGTSTSRQNGTSLATTGSTIRPLILAAAALIAAGALIALAARRRREA